MPLAPWPARLFVTVFVLAIAVCGAFSIEAWPLTGWRLFSHERRQIATGWMATSVDARGRETAIDFARFPKADRYFVSAMSTYATLSRAEQEATCQAWARLVRQHGGSTAGGLRLYATKRDMRRHVGRREPVAALPTLRWTCADGHGARAAVAGRRSNRAVSQVLPRSQ
jgi:hypothetical protein